MLAAREQSSAWELRAAWATGREVIVVFELTRVRGIVTRVAPTGAAAWIDDGLGEPMHVPCAAILSIRRPHFHEDGSTPRVAPRPQRVELPGQLNLFGSLGQLDLLKEV